MSVYRYTGLDETKWMTVSRVWSTKCPLHMDAFLVRDTYHNSMYPGQAALMAVDVRNRSIKWANLSI